MDVDGSAAGTSELGDDSYAAKFARRRCLPRTWRVYMDGYWALDHGDWQAAVDYLSDPSISEIDFLPQVIEALTTLVSPPSQALALVNQLVNPDRPLSTAAEAEAALLACASVAGMSAAFRRIRALPSPEDRKSAREAVWCWSLGAPRSHAGRGEQKAQPRALRELLNLALTDEENAHLVLFLAHPPREIPTAARSLLHDLVTLRLVHAGKYEESLALDKELAATDSTSATDRQRRREMVREFIDILPEAQRRVLLGADYARSASSTNNVPNGGTEDVDMSSSWVHVAEAPATNGSIIAPTPLRAPAIRALAEDRTPARSGSPFGGPPRFASPRPAGQGSRQTSPTRSEAPSTTPAPPPLPPQLRQSPPPSISSPFNPPVASSSRATPRKPKPIVVDDSPPVRRSTRRRSEPPTEEGSPERTLLTSTLLRAPSEAPIPEDAPAPAPTPKNARRARRTTAVAQKPEPKATPKTRRSTRASTVESTAETEEEPAIPGSFVTEKPRSTRKASKAQLEDEQPVKRTRKAPAPKRTTRATSEATDDGNRRITRGMSEVSEVESVSATPRRRRASPTPSATSQTSSPARRRTRQTTTTPRVTRSRK